MGAGGGSNLLKSAATCRCAACCRRWRPGWQLLFYRQATRPLPLPPSSTLFSPPPPALLPPSRNRYDCAGTIGVNPREIATRIMSIRSQIAKEFVQELKQVSEENSALMRETLVNSFSLTTTLEVEPGVVGDGGTHPEMVHPDFTDNSAIGADD